MKHQDFPSKLDWILFAVLAACVVALFGPPNAARADTVTASWVNAATNTDNTAIPASGAGSLVRTVVEYGTRNGAVFGTKAGEVFIAAPATSLQLNLVVVQEYALRAFHCNTYATTFAANAPGCSGFSNLAFRIVPPPTPSAPQTFSVTFTGTLTITPTP